MLYLSGGYGARCLSGTWSRRASSLKSPCTMLLLCRRHCDQGRFVFILGLSPYQLSTLPSHPLSHLCPNQEAQAYADDNSLLFMETSAKTAMNVNEIFMAIGELPLLPSPHRGIELACCSVVGPFTNRSFTIFNILIKSFSSSSDSQI